MRRKLLSGILISLASITTARANENFDLALGVGTSWESRTDQSAHSFRRGEWDLLVSFYFPLVEALEMRANLELGSSQNQASENNNGRDWRLGQSIGLVYDWCVVPSFAVDTGTIWLEEMQRYLGVRIGLGVPLFSGLTLVEPFFRYRRIVGEDRGFFGFGIELSFEIL